MRTIPAKQPRSRRAGYALILSMLSLALFGMAAAMLVKSLDWQRSIVRADAIRLQVDWLAQSALQRAAAKLSGQPDYAGETWSLTADDLGGNSTAKIVITATKATEPTSRRQLQIHLEYQEAGELVAQLSRTATVDTN